MEKEDQLINIGEAARLLAVCQDTLRKWERKGLIESVRTIGGHRRYKMSDIKRIQESYQTT
jgi:putative resolvase